MSVQRLPFASALAVAGFAVSLAIIPSSTPAQAAAAPYCIARGGSEGAATYVGNCVYADYQQCLEAAAVQRGNCVQNIDYHGEPAPSSPERRARRSR